MMKNSSQHIQDQLNELKTIKSNNTNIHKRRRNTVIQSQLRKNKLIGMGLSININEIQKLQSSIPHLVNVTNDPLMTESLLYPCREGTTRIGSNGGNNNVQQDIQLSGLKIQDEHAVLVNHLTDSSSGTTEVHIYPMEDAPLMVNGRKIHSSDGPVRLRHGDWILFGYNHVFRFKDPLNTGSDGGPIHSIARKLQYRDIIESASSLRPTTHRDQHLPKHDEWAAKNVFQHKDKMSIIKNLKVAMSLTTEANSIVEDMGFQQIFDCSISTTEINVQSLSLLNNTNDIENTFTNLINHGKHDIIIRGYYTNRHLFHELDKNFRKYEIDVDSSSSTSSIPSSTSSSSSVDPTQAIQDDENDASTMEYQRLPLFLETSLEPFGLFMINLRELYSKYLLNINNGTSNNSNSGKSAGLSAPMDDSGNRTMDATNSRNRSKSTAVFNYHNLFNSGEFKNRIIYQYIQCFIKAGIKEMNIIGPLKTRSNQYFASTNPTTPTPTPTAAATKGDYKKDERLLDPEEDDNGVTNTQYLMTLIKENAKLAHLLKIKNNKDNEMKHWPGTFLGMMIEQSSFFHVESVANLSFLFFFFSFFLFFCSSSFLLSNNTVDSSGQPAGYFSPDVKVFSDILNHDLESISSRWISNFLFSLEEK
jgi:hypothetical protein